MTIKNSVSNDFSFTLVESINVLDYHFYGVLFLYLICILGVVWVSLRHVAVGWSLI